MSDQHSFGITRELLGTSRIIPVVVLQDAAQAVPLARALLAGGIEAIELTFRTAAGADAIRQVRESVPGMTVGAGTLLSAEQVDKAVDAGAQFAVAPGFNRRVTERARERGLPFAPGVMTPTDVENALEAGFTTMKFFPAESAGGVPQLKSLLGPYKHMGATFIPTGGITATTAANYLQLPAVLAVGGSWLTPSDALSRGDWETITRIARESLEALS